MTRPVITLTPTGWTATVLGARGFHRCAIYVGTAPSGQAAFNEGEPTCNRISRVAVPWSALVIELAALVLGMAVGTAAWTVGRREIAVVDAPVA